MKERAIFVMRHGDQLLQDTATHGACQPDAPLTPKGQQVAEHMRDTHLADIKFAAHFTSPWLRAKETAKIVRPKARWKVIRTLAPRLPEVWDTLLASAAGSGVRGNKDVEKLWPGLLDMESEWMLRAIETALEATPSGKASLLVGHEPLISTLPRALNRAFPHYDIAKGAVCRLIFVDSPCFDEALSRVEILSPAA